MKNLMFVFLLAFQMGSAQETQVKQTIVTFFEGLHAKDTVKIKSVLAKEAVLHSISQKTPVEFSVENIQEFLKTIAGIPKNVKIEERLLSYKIQIDGNMAHVWTPYEFYVNDKISHAGVNSFQLYNDNGQWKITYCIDTRKRP